MYRGKRDKIVGILLVKRLLSIMDKVVKDRPLVYVRDVPLEEPMCVSIGYPIFDLLSRFREGKSTAASVLLRPPRSSSCTQQCADWCNHLGRYY